MTNETEQSPRAIVQVRRGEEVLRGYLPGTNTPIGPAGVWIDTAWTSLAEARKSFPEQTYRLVHLIEDHVSE